LTRAELLLAGNEIVTRRK